MKGKEKNDGVQMVCEYVINNYILQGDGAFYMDEVYWAGHCRWPFKNPLHLVRA